MYCAIDFGTSNSGIAVPAPDMPGGAVQLLDQRTDLGAGHSVTYREVVAGYLRQLKQQADLFNAAWTDALSRGRGWKTRALHGQRALLAKYPALGNTALWG